MIKRPYRAQRKGMHGASMVEFAIGMPIVAVIILGIFDAGMVLRQQSNLTDLTAELCRSVAADLGRKIPESNAQGNLNCPLQVADSGRVFLNTPARKAQLKNSQMEFTGKITKSAQSAKITVEGKVPLKCVICRFFLRNAELRASSDQLVESQLAADLCANGEVNIKE